MTHPSAWSDAAEDTDLTPLFEPGRIGTLTLPNRVLVSPMEKNYCTQEGAPTQRYIDYLVARARGGAALLRCEATFVDPAGKGRMYQLGAHTDAVVPALRRLVDSVHDAGGLISFELCHSGRQTNSAVSGLQPVAPSPIPCDVSGGYMPHELTGAEIRLIVKRFGEAAYRARQAGIDAIEVHGASGYLVNSFLSPFYNRRTDEYGGSPEARLRFALAVVEAVRSAVDGSIPLLFRLCADEFVEGGLTAEQSMPIAVALERAGVDMIDVAAGVYETIAHVMPPMEAPAGEMVTTAAVIRDAVGIPVCVGGKLASDLGRAAESVRAGEVDFVTIARGFHADPELLAKSRSGQHSHIRRCISCNECSGLLGLHQPAYCAVNPATGRESKFRSERSTTVKSVLVVGGGPAGLEAARAARLRGHEVRLVERAMELGGQARYGSLVQGREPFFEPVRFLRREAERLGVEVVMGLGVTADYVRGTQPDVLVLATGARAASIPAAVEAGVSTADALDVLEFCRRNGATVDADIGSVVGAEPGARILIGDATWTSCHTASILLSLRFDVSMVTSDLELGERLGRRQGRVMRDRLLADPHFEFIPGATIETATDGTAVIWHASTDSRSSVAADVLISGTRLQPCRELLDELGDTLPGVGTVRMVGDCVDPRKLQDALYEGALAGSQA